MSCKKNRTVKDVIIDANMQTDQLVSDLKMASNALAGTDIDKTFVQQLKHISDKLADIVDDLQIMTMRRDKALQTKI